MDYSLLIGIHNHEKEDSWSGPPSPKLSQLNVGAPKMSDTEYVYPPRFILSLFLSFYFSTLFSFFFAASFTAFSKRMTEE